MDEEDFFDAQFPGTSVLLRNMRAQDSEFDRICLDYQEMMTELAQSPLSDTGVRPRYLADLAETVTDLRSSIEAKLSDVPGTLGHMDKTKGLK